MKRFFSIGEALIDFIPSKTNVNLKDVPSFTKTAGGAPANVCACVSKQGIDSGFIGMLGEDAFGDYLIDMMKKAGISLNFVLKTNKANTTLAFVSLKEDGEREFSFYRKPGADMLLDEKDIKDDWFNKGDFLHFCSVDLVEAPVKYAHKKAIEIVKSKNGTIVFDPNLRFPLWDDKAELKRTVLDFIPYADILKISDNELEFICGTDNVKKAAKIVFGMGVKLLIYTMGSEGSRVITNDIDVFCPAFKVDAVDATGAGDAFIGCFIAGIIKDDIDIQTLNDNTAKILLEKANACGAIVATKHGAIASMPSSSKVDDFISKYNS